MSKRFLVIIFTVLFPFTLPCAFAVEDIEVFGVKFPGEKMVEGKTLKLNGAAGYKVMGFMKVYARAIYMEKPTSNAKEAIESEQIKQSYMYYLTKVKGKQTRKSFIEAMEKANPPELVKIHRGSIEKNASWMDKDGNEGMISITTYVPGKGLIVNHFGELKGVIPDKEYAQMYFRYIFGEKADKNLRDRYLGQ